MNAENVRPSPPKASTPGAFSRETSPSHGYGTGFSYFKGWMPPQAHIFPQSFPHSSATSVLETGHLQGKAAVGQETSSSDMLGGNPKARRTVQDSPLKVRKTRENLREAVREYNAPNRTPSAQSKSGFFRTSSEEQTPHQPSGRPYHKYSAADMITCPSVAYHRHSLDLDRVRADPTIEEEAHERPSSALEHTPRLSRRKSIHRRVLSKVKEGILTRSRSTAKMIGHKDHDVLDVYIADSMEVQVTLLDARNDLENAPGRLDSNTPGLETKSHSCGSPSPEKTPRPAYRPTRSPESSPTPLRRASPVPTSPEPLFIKLNVISDICSLDIFKELTVWVCVEVRAATATTSTTSSILSATGEISKLRLSISPGSCQIKEAIGQCSIGSLQLGETAEVFLQIQIPRVESTLAIRKGIEALSSDLERMLGVLQTDLFAVTARYRHSAFPDTILSTREVCRVQRTNESSIWSLDSDNGSADWAAEKRLVRYLLQHHNSQDEATAMLHKYIAPSHFELHHLPALHSMQPNANLPQKPSSASNPQRHQASRPDPAPSSSTLSISTTSPLPSTNPSRNPSRNPSTASTTTSTSISLSLSPTGSDDARRIWRHMRHTSRSASAATRTRSSVESIEALAARDELAAEIRRRAVANKRSLGAETLRDLMGEGGGGGEGVG